MVNVDSTEQRQCNVQIARKSSGTNRDVDLSYMPDAQCRPAWLHRGGSFVRVHLVDGAVVAWPFASGRP